MERMLKRMGLASIVSALVGGAAIAQPAVPPPTNVALIGVTEVAGKTQAWLVDLRTQRRETVSPGQEAFGYRVKRVDPERVTLTRGKQQFTVRLGEKPLPVATAPAVVPPAPVLIRPAQRMPRVTAARIEVPVEEFQPEIAPPVTTNVEPQPSPERTPAPEFYPGYPGQPDYGFAPGYGFDPRYPEMTDPYPNGYFGYPGYGSGYPRMSPEASGYPDYLGQPYPGALYPTWPAPYGMSGVPATTGPDFLGNVSGPRGPRWNSQTSRRRGAFLPGGTPTNPQTQRRRQTVEPR